MIVDETQKGFLALLSELADEETRQKSPPMRYKISREGNTRRTPDLLLPELGHRGEEQGKS